MQIIINWIILISSFLTAVTTICVFLKKAINKAVSKWFAPIYKKIDDLDVNQCTNYLVTFLKSVEKGEIMDDVEIQRAHEVYDHYIKDLKGNSYIHDKWEKLMK